MRIVLALAITVHLALAQQNADKPRVFITDSQSWEMVGAAAGANGAFASQVQAGARPQTAEIIKTFGERCPNVITNNRIEKADYVVVLDHEGGKGYLRHRNKVAVFGRISGDSVVSHSTLSLGNSVKDACDGIDADWKANGAAIRAMAATSAVPEQKVAPASAAKSEAITSGAHTRLSLASVPDGAEVEVDGNFVGSTPSMVDLQPGAHTIVVKKKGFTNWERKAQLSAGDVRINAELDESPNVATNPSATLTVAKSPVATQAPTSPPSVTPIALVAAPVSRASEPDPEPAVQMDPVAVAVISDPQGAELFVDSKGFGSTPKQFQLKPGSHSIQVVKAGYRDWSTKLIVEEGAPTTVKAKLEKNN